MLVKDINQLALNILLLITINIMHKQEVLFFCSFQQACIGSYDNINNNLNLNLANNIFFLYNNIINLPELK